MKVRDPNALLRILFLLPAFAMALWAMLKHWRRPQQLEETAPKLGLAFEKKDKNGLLMHTLRGLPLMKQFYVHVSNVHRGQARGAALVVFDHHWSSPGNSGDQTVASYALPGRALPEFQLRPESATDRLVAKLGFQDVDFDTHPRFSASYRLETKDEGAIRTIFRPELLDHLEGEPGWSLEGRGEWLVAYRAGRLVEPPGLHAFVEQTGRIAERLRGCTAPAAQDPGPR